MGQKTIKKMIASAQRPIDPNVDFLSSTQDAKDLLYEYDVQAEVEEDSTPSGDQAADETPAPQQPVAAPASAPAPTAPVASMTIEDVSLTGEQVVQTLIARKLGKQIAEVATSKSIRELCGGKIALHEAHRSSSSLITGLREVNFAE